MKLATLSLILVLIVVTKNVDCRLSLEDIIRLLQQQDEYYPYYTDQGLPGAISGVGGGGGGAGGGAGMPGLPGLPGKR